MNHTHNESSGEMEILAVRIRQDIIKMIHAAGSGHPAGSLGMTDVMVALYFRILRHDPKNPDWPERDRFLLSNGHICPARYVTMARAGYFPPDELLTLRDFGSRLQGHPERLRLPGLESTSGPLGAGLAQGAGLAYAARMDGQDWRTYVLTSDGEHGAGLHWEAVLFAGKNRLTNLTCIVDRNGIQIDGPTEEVMPLEPLREKYLAFNWNVIEIDGNDIGHVVEATELAKSTEDRPTCIIAKNVPGRGVSFMENDHRWHGQAPNDEETEQALAELQETERELTMNVD
ncbi:transketolase [Candidatus Uhrbacteria bacterium CG_4_10_14_0_8_um_filter_58_22]|uniref:Transketolase n=1 Tax=Candidatus Uhrbacteria bacterium CG_4_10_14_0_8_um_filter_58_22 TaxID=1975029 RepID=A0A2M7QA67_9BACT|nr:MAG: transketolase [Parcubacteria group bacterium CG1_02_58_44]PIY62816.1 MAG: transketolase [Candidatus Uhrbacteria bacterium CG_4_10_14_0_8_um_filter_58_22]